MSRNLHIPSVVACLIVILAAGIGCGESPQPESESVLSDSMAGLRDALLLHAGFDNGPDAAFAKGDRRLYTAPSYKELANAAPGIGNPDVEIVTNEGRFQHVLRFNKKNEHAIFYRAQGNVAYSPSGWNGTISFWLSLEPDKDLEGFVDPIQITDADYSDACIWVDFPMETPRPFRLGAFGDLTAWNPEQIRPNQHPRFQEGLVVVQQPPFARGKWTHVVITHEGLGSPQGGSAALYLDGEQRGAATRISHPFTWELANASIRVGVNYVGLFDELAIFNRALTAEEVQMLNGLKEGAAGLRP